MLPHRFAYGNLYRAIRAGGGPGSESENLGLQSAATRGYKLLLGAHVVDLAERYEGDPRLWESEAGNDHGMSDCLLSGRHYAGVPVSVMCSCDFVMAW